MSTSEDELVGQQLGGRYRVVRPLGRGGMGTVYEALDVDLGRRVALKVMLPALSRDPVLLERFRREVRNTGMLTHPNVVQVFDFGRSSSEPPFLVMELLEGRPLIARLKKGRLDPRRAARIALQVLSALSAAHDLGVVHRDLKPENVFLIGLEGGVELVKLLDFGLAKLMDDEAFARLTRAGVLVGTPRYAAPEQVKGSHDVDERTDIYAAGVLLYAMITGRPPFLASAPQLWTDLLQKEPTDPRVVVAQLPDELVEIVRKAMSKRPADRYPSARAMSDALSAFLAGRSTRSLLPAEPTLAPTATATVDPAPAPAPRRRASWAPLVLVLGGLFAALTFGGLALLAWSLLASPEALAPTPAPMSDPQPPDRATPTVPSSGAPGAAAGSPTPPMRPIAPVPAVAPQPVVPGARSVSTTCAHYQRRACSCPSRPGLCAEARREVDGWQRELAHDPAQIERACASALASAERDCDSGGLVEPWPPPSPRR